MPNIKPPIHPPPGTAYAKKDERENIDESVEHILQLKSKHQQILALAKQDLARAGERSKNQVAKFLVENLRGQLPAATENALHNGKLQGKTMNDLIQRLANTAQNAVLQARDPAQARALANDPSTPQQALRWTQFVQKTQHVPGSHIQKRDTSASPKGSAANFIELLAQSKNMENQGPGLRNPKLVPRGIQELSPQEKVILMEAVFGEKLAKALENLNIRDPLNFVTAGQLPEGRTNLAQNLKMPKARLLAYLMRAELLKIGRGRNGEMGIRPDHLKPLSQAGISMLGSLHALRSFKREDLSTIFKRFRQAMSLSPKLLKQGRPIIKRDFLHWARSASRQPSEIYLLGRENMPQMPHVHEPQELIQAWYLENLLWQELQEAKQEQRESLDYLKRERERENEKEKEKEEHDEEEVYEHDEDLPHLDEDKLRSDQLNCFWITDYNTLSSKPGAIRRMYVCLDSNTGAIIPQQIEVIEAPLLQGQDINHE